MDDELEICVGDVKEFFIEILGRKHLHRPDNFPDGQFPVSVADVDELVTGRPLPLSSVVLSRENSIIDQSLYRAEPGPSYPGPADCIDPVKVVRLVESGATLVVRPASLHLPRLRAFCNSFERSFGHGVDADLFITPPDSRGFEIHADAAESFVIQLTGTKDWELFEPVRSWQHRSFGAAPPGDLTPAARYRMRPGDLLYVPRGMPHLARSTDYASVHVTVSVNTICWSDLLGMLAKTALALPEFQAPIPMGAELAGATAEQLPGVLARLSSLIGNLGSNKAFVDQVVRSRENIGNALRPGLLANLIGADTVNPASSLRIRPGVWPVVRTADNDVSIHVGPNRFPVSEQVAAACSLLLDRDIVGVSELSGARATALSIARTLIRCGIAESHRKDAEAPC